MCIPLVARGETLGLLTLLGDEPTGDHKEILTAATEQLALGLSNLQLHETALRAQAIRDPLTSLYNRRYMDETLVREISRVQRRGLPLSIVMVDIDHFKRLNDTAGHAAGDEVLKRVAQQLMSGVRREDVPCRFGGEEFALVLPELPVDKAVERAERLRKEIEALSGMPAGRVTASFGVASFPADGASGEAVLRAADVALYQAKNRGRNRVVAAGEMAAPPAVARHVEVEPPVAGSGVAPLSNHAGRRWSLECLKRPARAAQSLRPKRAGRVVRGTGLAPPDGLVFDAATAPGAKARLYIRDIIHSKGRYQGGCCRRDEPDREVVDLACGTRRRGHAAVLGLNDVERIRTCLPAGLRERDPVQALVDGVSPALVSSRAAAVVASPKAHRVGVPRTELHRNDVSASEGA